MLDASDGIYRANKINFFSFTNKSMAIEIKDFLAKIRNLLIYILYSPSYY